MGASSYFPWVRGLHAEIELAGVQFPGREGRIREKPFIRLSLLAKAASDAIRDHLDKPYAFFGHSMGALVAFEVARFLRLEGAPGPERLFLSGRRAPTLPNLLPNIHELPDVEFIDQMQHRWGGIPPAVLQEPELLQLLLPTLRADVTVLETYAYAEGEPLDCPISVFGGESDASAKHDDLAAWSEQTSSDVRLRMFSGGHFFLRDHQRSILDAVHRDLFP